MLLNGACIHHDNGLLGANAIDRAEERKIELLKANGYNAIRLSHNPYSTYLYDVCDRLGMLVIDEAFDMWNLPKHDNDYHLHFNQWWEKDLEAMIFRDRNHPSVILWSIGNEIPERFDSLGYETRDRLFHKVRELDPTRKVTEALCPGPGWREGTPRAFGQLDIAGYNYVLGTIESDHAKYPERVSVGTEIFANQVFQSWQLTKKNPYVIGGFVWTGMDHLGEAAIGYSSLMGKSKDTDWPWFNNYCGDIDLIGEDKPQKAYRDVIWDMSKIEMNVHAPIPEGIQESVSMWGWPEEWPIWNWEGNEGKSLDIRVFTKASHVRLILNGQIIGEKNLTDKDQFIARFEVPYQPGELVSIAMDNGKETARKTLKTAGRPATIRLTADREKINANCNDLSYIKIEVIDKDGVVVPSDSVTLHLSVSGDGELAASGNANPKDMESFNNRLIRTYKGKAQVIYPSVSYSRDN